jgi:hypothetical protein
MYAKNAIARRRSSGWSDRRRYYRHLFEQARTKALEAEAAKKAAPAGAKD